MLVKIEIMNKSDKKTSTRIVEDVVDFEQSPELTLICSNRTVNIKPLQGYSKKEYSFTITLYTNNDKLLKQIVIEE